jgi:hypothetical protein
MWFKIATIALLGLNLGLSVVNFVFIGNVWNEIVTSRPLESEPEESPPTPDEKPELYDGRGNRI